MNIFNKLSLTVGFIAISSLAFGQPPMVTDQGRTGNQTAQSDFVNDTWLPSLVEDGIIDRVPHSNILLPIYKVREIDIAWQATVWRKIDARQKQNMAFKYTGDEYTGGGAFIEILNDAVKKGKIQAFSNVDDRFTQVLSMAEFEKVLGTGKDTTFITDVITGEEIQKIIDNEFNVNSVNQYELKEKWIFDRNRGRMVVQIIGIAPLKDVLDPNTGEYISSSPMYWLHYPDLRPLLVNYEVYNPKNDLKRMSWTDFLDGHFYQSYVVKTSLNNHLDRYIPEQNTLKALADGERLLNDIIQQEMDMWQE